MSEHTLKQRGEGTGERSYIQSFCSCGWVGDKHYAFEAFQRTDLALQEQKHLRMVKEKEND